VLADGSSVRGCYEAGVLGGGVLEFAPGGALRYAGGYVDGAREGRGVAVLDDGGVFDAQWRGGLLHGRGLYFYPTGPAPDATVLFGEWRDGEATALHSTGDGWQSEPQKGVPGKGKAVTLGPGVALQAAARARAAERSVRAGLPLEAALGPLPRKPPRARSLRLEAGDPLQEKAVIFHTYDGRCVEWSGAAASVARIGGGGNMFVGTYARRSILEGELIGFLPCLGPDGALARSSVPNAAFEPVEHPLFGETLGLRALRDIAEGEEVYSNLLFADPERWEEGLSHRSEEGFYCHMRGAPCDTLVRRSGGADCNGVVQVKQYGPWRALVFNSVEQGMTFHAREGEEGYDPFPNGSDLSAACGELACLDEPIPARPRREPGLLTGASPENSGDEDFAEAPPPCGRALPTVIGFEYQLVLACAVAGALSEAPSTDQGRPLGRPPQRVLNIGLGSGAVQAFLQSQHPSCRVLSVEVDEHVMECVRLAHGFEVARVDGKLDPRRALASLGGSASAPPDPRVLACVHGDAKDVVNGYARYSNLFDCVVLDAYDGEGRVPAHLQEEDFLRQCGESLSPGGWVVANLFNGEEARGATSRFVAALEAALGAGAPSVVLPVHTQETNVVLAARKPVLHGEAGAGRRCTPAQALAAGLARACDAAHRAAAATEPNYLRCLRACRDSAARQKT